MASDQSETSGGSRVRQFGLYRSIDSRTEEFLRLSRRRQMRQGCACAAISTAITVTIIVGALLLFEYNVTSNEENKSHVRNWHNLLNDTAEAMSLNTLKMLPIIIKELNKNKADITGETTTKRQTQEKPHTTEFSYKKNVFSNRKNWIRLPTSRIYAIEYKTPPIAYFKTPRNDYFTKIRKIRDYQRIINYVDKMISDRVAFGSTQPMQTNEDYATDDVSTPGTTPSKKLARTPDQLKEPSSNIFPTTGKPKPNDASTKTCNCPNKIGDILNDLVWNIKLLVPHSSTTESQNQNLQSDMLTRSIKDFTPSANLHSLKGEVVKGLLNQNLKLRHSEKSGTNTDKPTHKSLSSLGYEETDGKTVFGLLQQQITGQKTYFFKGFLKNATETSAVYNVSVTESYNPLHFIPPPYREGNKKNQSQKMESTAKEQYTHLHDPLRFNANTQDEDEEENMKNEDYKAPPEQVISTPTSRLNFANNYPLHFIANTRDYEESSVKNNYKKTTSVKDISTPILQTVSITSNFQKSLLRYDDKRDNIQGIITTSTTETSYAKQDLLNKDHNRQEYQENYKTNNDKEISSGKTKMEVAGHDILSTRYAADQLYLKPISPLNNMNKTYVFKQPDIDINLNNLLPRRNDLNKTLNENVKLGYNNLFYPMITTHFLYHRHNITTSPPSKSDLTTTTTINSSPSSERTTSSTPIDVEETTLDFLKIRNKGNDVHHNYQKFKDDTGFRFEELNLDDDFDKIINEDNYQEINEKDDFISTVFNNLETQTKPTVVTTSKMDLQLTTDPRDKDDVFFTSSVFHNKPRSYLEIQRNYLNEN